MLFIGYGLKKATQGMTTIWDTGNHTLKRLQNSFGQVNVNWHVIVIMAFYKIFVQQTYDKICLISTYECYLLYPSVFFKSREIEKSEFTENFLMIRFFWIALSIISILRPHFLKSSEIKRVLTYCMFTFTTWTDKSRTPVLLMADSSIAKSRSNCRWNQRKRFCGRQKSASLSLPPSLFSLSLFSMSASSYYLSRRTRSVGWKRFLLRMWEESEFRSPTYFGNSTSSFFVVRWREEFGFENEVDSMRQLRAGQVIKV